MPKCKKTKKRTLFIVIHRVIHNIHMDYDKNNMLTKSGEKGYIKSTDEKYL